MKTGPFCIVFIIKIWITSPLMPGLEWKGSVHASLSCTRVFMAFYMFTLTSADSQTSWRIFRREWFPCCLQQIHNRGLNPFLWEPYRAFIPGFVYPSKAWCLIGAIEMLMDFRFWLVDLEWDLRCIFPQNCWVFSRLMTTNHSFESNIVYIFLLMCSSKLMVWVWKALPENERKSDQG